MPLLCSSHEDFVARSIVVVPAQWIRIFIRQAKVRTELALNRRKLKCVITITMNITLPSVMQHSARNKGFLLNEVIKSIVGGEKS